MFRSSMRSSSGSSLFISLSKLLILKIIKIFKKYYQSTVVMWQHMFSVPVMRTVRLREQEYQEYFLGVKAAGAKGRQPYHLHVPNVLKPGSLNFLEPSGTVQDCNRTVLPLPLKRWNSSHRWWHITLSSIATKPSLILVLYLHFLLQIFHQKKSSKFRLILTYECFSVILNFTGVPCNFIIYCMARKRRREMHAGFWWKNLNARLMRGIIWNWILNTWDRTAWNLLRRLKIRNNSRFLWGQNWTFDFCLRW